MPLDDLGPVIAAVMTMLIPIIWILTHHQRKMAELMHGKQNGSGQVTPQTEYEIAQMKQAIHQQTIALDTLMREVKALREQQSSSLSARLQANTEGAANSHNV